MICINYNAGRPNAWQTYNVRTIFINVLLRSITAPQKHKNVTLMCLQRQQITAVIKAHAAGRASSITGQEPSPCLSVCMCVLARASRHPLRITSDTPSPENTPKHPDFLPDIISRHSPEHIPRHTPSVRPLPEIPSENPGLEKITIFFEKSKTSI